ncbi:putative peptidyl-tRNA hydrolase PTRHD1, partial [Varanus komodoensis]
VRGAAGGPPARAPLVAPGGPGGPGLPRGPGRGARALRARGHRGLPGAGRRHADRGAGGARGGRPPRISRDSAEKRHRSQSVGRAARECSNVRGPPPVPKGACASPLEDLQTAEMIFLLSGHL